MPKLTDTRVVHGPNNSIFFDTGGADTVIPAEPDEDGLRIPKPLRGTPVTVGGQTWPSQWHLDAYVAALHRELAGVERRLEHLGHDHLPHDRPASSEDIELTRIELETGKQAIVAELARLDPEANARKHR